MEGQPADRLWPFIGRGSELVRLVDDYRTPGVHASVVVGAGGLGKSRLLRELVNEVDCAGGATATVAAGRVADLAPALRSLESQTVGKRRLLAIDDAHLLEDRSAELALRATGRGMFVVATITADLWVPERVAELWRHDSGRRLQLMPLSFGDVGELVASVLGAAVAPATLAELGRLSEGNPLVLRELVFGGLESKALHVDGPLWRHTDGLFTTQRVRQLVDSRVGASGTAERDVIDALAVTRALSVDILERLASGAVLERLEKRGIIAVREDGVRHQAEISSPLDAECVRRSLPITRARSLVRTIAGEVGSFGARRRTDHLVEALGSLAGGRPVQAASAVSAARQAYSDFDPELASRLARAALAAGGEDFEARLVLSQALASQNRPVEAEEILCDLAAGARGDDQVARVARARAAQVLSCSADPQGAIELLDEAVAELESDSARQGLEVDRARILLQIGHTAAAAQAAERAAGPSLDDPDLLRAVLVAGAGLAALGRPRRAVRYVDRGLQQSRADAGPLAMAQLTTTKARALLIQGEILEAEAVARRAYHGASSSLQEHAVTAVGLAEVMLARGRVRAASLVLDEPLNRLAGRDALGVLPDQASLRGQLAVLRAYSAALLGDRPAVDAALDVTRALPDEYSRNLRGHVLRAEGWQCAVEGKPAKAADLSLAAARAFRDIGWSAQEAFCLHDVVRMGDPGLVGGRLGELAESAPEPQMVTHLADHALALADANGVELGAIARTFTSLGADLYATEVAAQSVTAHEQAGDAVAAREAAAQATALAVGLDGVGTQTARMKIDRLTEREHEVAVLAADGLTSREIADRLVISVRTVDNHLSRVYPKLGVHSRGELTWLFDSPGSTSSFEASPIAIYTSV